MNQSNQKQKKKTLAKRVKDLEERMETLEAIVFADHKNMVRYKNAEESLKFLKKQCSRFSMWLDYLRVKMRMKDIDGPAEYEVTEEEEEEVNAILKREREDDEEEEDDRKRRRVTLD